MADDTRGGGSGALALYLRSGGGGAIYGEIKAVAWLTPGGGEKGVDDKSSVEDSGGGGGGGGGRSSRTPAYEADGSTLEELDDCGLELCSHDELSDSSTDLSTSFRASSISSSWLDLNS